MHKYRLLCPRVGNIRFGNVAATLLVGLLGSCANGDGYKPEDFSSDWISISSGNVLGKMAGGKLEFVWTVHNKTGEPLWVEATFPAPPFNPECVVTKKAANVEKEFFVCEQETMAADTDYPVRLKIYRDEDLSQLAEATEAKLRFRQKETEAILHLVTPPTLPAVFEGVNYSEKLGLGAIMFSGFAFDNGTLYVDENGVRYSSENKNINIPASQIRNEKVKELGNSVWVIVEYYMDGQDRRIGFQQQSFSGSPLVNEDIGKAIYYVRFVLREEQ